ncbi:MAG TPA: hypothetical protein VKT31_01815 [Solirubrobacteraceae bacterium]|nr:hypothetical protein [Solirubrobacteraceae bacterium]
MGLLSAVVVLALPAVAAAKTKVVYAGGPAAFQNQIGNKYGGEVTSFMRQRITINVGDSVVWNGKSLANGFHTVDIPKLHGSDLPLIMPSGGNVPSTVLDAAGNPFWFDGKLPNLGLDPTLFAPSGGVKYNGSARVDSGLPLGPPKDFKVKFTKAGTYEYFCDVHPGMHGWVIVLAKGKHVPSAKDDAKALKASEKHYVAEVKALDKTKVTGANVQLGAAKPDGAEILAFFPATLQVKAGTTVTFMIAKHSAETHTASFGPADYLQAQANIFFSPTTGAVDPIAAFPSDPPGSITLTPTSHGNGFANVGALDQDASTKTIPASGKIDFTTPGTYHYICLIHPFMHGTVIVK